MTSEFSVGDRVLTPGDNFATVMPKPWHMPHHTLIQVDAGAKIWIKTELLQLASAAAATVEPAPQKRKRSKRSCS